MATYGSISIVVPPNPAPLPRGYPTSTRPTSDAQGLWPSVNQMVTPPPPGPDITWPPYTPPMPPPVYNPLPPTPPTPAGPGLPAPYPSGWGGAPPPGGTVTPRPGTTPGPDEPGGPTLPTNPWPGGGDIPGPDIPGTEPPYVPPPAPTPAEPKYWEPDINSYMVQLYAWLNSQRDAWQQQYRGLGNTSTNWVDWASQQYNPAFSQWLEQNFRAPAGYSERIPLTGYRSLLASGFKNWLKQNSVNYTNPVRLPMRNRMQVPVTDWTRLAGPDQGIPSGFSERATASPWTADYRGGAFGPTGRLPSWTTQGTPPMTPKLGGAW